MQWVKRDTAEWRGMWQAIGHSAPCQAVAFLDDDGKPVKCGEVWQYMGTANGVHDFRHRCGKRHNLREYAHIRAGANDPAFAA